MSVEVSNLFWPSAADSPYTVVTMHKYEYKRVTVDIVDVEKPTFEEGLNALGAQGWELVSAFDRERGGNSKEVFFIYKRQI